MSATVIEVSERKKRAADHEMIERMRVWGIISRNEADRRKFANDGFASFLETTNRLLLPKVRATSK